MYKFNRHFFQVQTQYQLQVQKPDVGLHLGGVRQTARTRTDGLDLDVPWPLGCVFSQQEYSAA